MGENPLLQKLWNIKNGDIFILLSQVPKAGGSTGENRFILLLSNTAKLISYCMGRSATNFIRKLNESTFGMCSMTQCKEKNRSGPGGTWVLSVMQEKILAGVQVQMSLFLQDSIVA